MRINEILVTLPTASLLDIHPNHANKPWDYDKVSVNVRVKAGDVVYLIAAYDELYAWGHLVYKIL